MRAQAPLAKVGTAGHAPKVAMFVLNPCHSDARVIKEAQALGAEGYDVRVFALGNSLWPAGVFEQDGFSIERIEVVSRYQRILRGTASLYRRQQPTAVAGAFPPVAAAPVRRLPRPVKALLALLALPLLAVQGLLELLRTIGRALQAVAARLGAVAEAAGDALRRQGDRVAAPLRSWAEGLDDDDPRLVNKAYWTSRRLWFAFVRRPFRLVVRRLRWARRRVGWIARRTVRRLRRGLRRRLWALKRLRRRLARRLYLRVVRFLRKRLLVLHRPSVFVQFWKASGAAARSWAPDVVHAHDLNVLPGALTAAEGEGGRVPVVYDSHELWRHRNRVTRFHPVGKAFDALQERRLIRRCDLVITVSPSIARWLVRRYRLPSERTVVVRNVPARAPVVRGATVRELAGLDGERILLYTGRVTSGRGIEEAVDALPGLPQDLVLVMLGYGEPMYLEELWERADARGVRTRVHLVPPVASEQVSAVAASADLALVAIQPLCLSYRFSLPNKLFEAIQAHVPVVATDLPEIAAVVGGYAAGEVFQPGDAQGFRDAVLALLADPERYRSGVRAAAEDLVWEKESRVLVEAYASVVGVEPAPPAAEAAPTPALSRSTGPAAAPLHRSG